MKARQVELKHFDLHWQSFDFHCGSKEAQETGARTTIDQYATVRFLTGGEQST